VSSVCFRLLQHLSRDVDKYVDNDGEELLTSDASHNGGLSNWVASIDLGWVDGKRKRRTFQSKTQAEAIRKMREFQPKKSQGLQLASEHLTVEQYLQTWLTKRIPGTVSIRTEEIYERVIRLYLVHYLGKIRLNKLTPKDVNEMMIALGDRGLSSATKRMARATLRRALRMAEQDGLIARNVAAIAEGPKMDYKEGRTLTPEQAQIFLIACKENRLGAAYALALSLGLRRGEIIGLKWSDIELTANAVVISIRRQLVRDKAGVRLSDLKTRGSRRTLHLSASLVTLLEGHRLDQEEEARLRGDTWHNEEGLIFTSTCGLPLDPGNFGRGVPQITEKAGLGHWSIHELRHSCASLMFSTDVPLEAVADQLGHASINVTKGVYVHLLPGSRAKAAKAMEELLYKDFVHVTSPRPEPVASPLARHRLAKGIKTAPIRVSVGRPGLDPGTLGLKGTRTLYRHVALVN
jgi:integrase